MLVTNARYVACNRPDFAKAIAARFADRAKTKKTLVTHLDATIDFVNVTLRMGEGTRTVPPFRAEMQRLLVALPGAENFVCAELAV